MEGFRFFRDDAILAIWETRIKCVRCGVWGYPNEIKNVYGQDLCEMCNNLFRGRINALEDCNRKECPINSWNYISTKKYHKQYVRHRK